MRDRLRIIGYILAALVGYGAGVSNKWLHTTPTEPVACPNVTVNVPKCEFPRIDLTVDGITLKDLGRR